MQQIKVTLTKEKETLLMVLYAKARESLLPDSVLHDHFAKSTIDQIDYDFKKLKINDSMVFSVGIRARVLDDFLRSQLAKYPDATVLHLGCGLDTRIQRVDPSSSVRWYDVDYPEVIELRRAFYPSRPNYKLIGKSVTDPTLLDDIPDDRPVIVVAEGLMPYLPKDEVVPLMRRLTQHFVSGQIVFDGYSRLGVKTLVNHPSIKATGAKLHWGIDKPSELTDAIPQLEYLGDLSQYTNPLVDRLSLLPRLSAYLCLRLPVIKDLGRFMHYKF